MLKTTYNKYGKEIRDEKLGLEVLKLEEGFALVKHPKDCGDSFFVVIKGGFSTEEECIDWSNQEIAKIRHSW